MLADSLQVLIKALRSDGIMKGLMVFKEDKKSKDWDLGQNKWINVFSTEYHTTMIPNISSVSYGMHHPWVYCFYLMQKVHVSKSQSGKET